ncbi:MAG: M6 family metalloprotease domain-containing protein [Bacteroidaceae bacterium]
MTINRIIGTALLHAWAVAVFAIPAKPGQWRTLQLTDGTKVLAELKGDEYGAYWTDNEGYAYVLAADGCYCKADLPQVEAESGQARTKANQMRMTRATETGKFMGKKRGLIILVEFNKRSATSTPAMTFTQDNPAQYYDRVANEVNFTDPEVGFKGSVYDYFLAQSYGQFEFNFDIVGPYRLPNPYNYYGQDNGTMLDTHLGQLIYDACDWANDDVDFTQYDWDGDGTVDQVFILYAGQGQNVNGADTGLIWPQEGTLNAFGSDQKPFQMDGVTIDHFACSSELGEGGRIDGIGTICHEFSHCFGLPDMYDKGTFGATTLNYGTYVWDLMNMGNYLDNGYQPAGYTAYQRAFCGWMTLKELKDTQDIQRMQPLAVAPEAYIIYNEGHRDEYYIVENRQQTGCDAGLPGSGLLVSHVDYSKEAWDSNNINTGKERFSILAADNTWQMIDYKEWEQNADEMAGDLYPCQGNNALTATSTPAAAVNHPNKDGSMMMQKDLTDIAQHADGTMSFRFTNHLSTGIHSVRAEEAEMPCYNLAGQRIHQPKGLYIKKDKKLLNR